ncbi:MAG: recombinase family protein [Oscillospiraceae bacterium]|nr:recombinase family protein [Oscillospiraceae bacterium]
MPNWNEKQFNKEYRTHTIQGAKKATIWGGQVPYGFKKESTLIDGVKTSKFVVDIEESEHIKLIYSLYANSNNSLNDVIRYLVANNVKRTTGKNWSSSKISTLLSNPIYVQSDLAVYDFFKSQGADIINDVSEFNGRGCYLYQGTVSTSKKQADLKDKEVVIAPHEGFIPSDIWLACRLRCLNNRQSTKTCKGKNSWLIGKMKCGCCGYAVVIRKAKTKWSRYGVCSNKEQMKMCEGLRTALYTLTCWNNMFSMRLKND